MAKLQLQSFTVSPPAPPSGFALIYFKTDNILYIKGDDGVEHAIGVVDSITDLNGDVIAHGPGDVTATVAFVGGKSAAEIAQAVLDTQSATSSNTPNTIVLRDAMGGFSAGTIVADLSGNVSGSSSSFTGSLVGDVTGTQGATVVSTVGGKTASAVAQSVTDTQAATHLDTPNTIVKRDGSGDFSAGTITADLDGDISGSATSFTGPLVGDVTGTQGATVVSTVGGSSAANVHSAELAANAATALDTPSTIVKRDSSGNFVANQITSDLVGHVTGAASDNVLKAGDTMTGELHITAAGTGLDVSHDASIGGDLHVTGNVDAANISGSNTGDVTVTDTNSIDLTLSGQNVSADLKLSSDAADANNLKATTTIHSGAGAGLHVEVPFAVPVQIGTTNFVGAASSLSLSDHVHSHGNQTVPTLHAPATSLANGFMSSTDKAKTDAELPASIGTTNQVLGVNNAGTAGEYKSLVGTANQVSITDAVGSKTFALPQDIAPASTPTFSGVNVSNRIEFTQTSTPVTPAATKADIYTDVSQGFSRLRYIDETGSVQTILRDTIFLTFNNTGSTIPKGKAVYISGSASNFITIGLAKADSGNTMACIGLSYESIPNNSYGRVISIGILSGFDTSAFSAGDKIYVSATTAGSLTNVRPSTPPNLSQKIGVVTSVNATTGSMEVRPQQVNGGQSGSNVGFTLNTIALTDAANITTDASLGNTFTVTLGGNRNLSAPTNPTPNQKIIYKISQDGTGGRGLTFDAIFNFGLDILAFVPSSGANKTDYVGCIYNGATSKWDIVAVSKGF